jgi:methyl-accepting chemotaxis protein
VQANASSAEETASSAEELLAQVENLNEIVSQLVKLVTGKTVNSEQFQGRAERVKELKTTYEVNKKHPEKLSPERVIPFEEDEDLKE